MKNGELHFSSEKDGKKKTVVIIIQKYVCKWMARRVYLKLLSATIFIQCCWKQVRARKELQRLQQEAKEFSIIHIGDLRMNHLKEKEMIRSKQGQIWI
jgi:hypothetical protein